ncbi:MAG: hypothetical protein ABIB41_00580 [Nitrospirota bacterium]
MKKTTIGFIILLFSLALVVGYANASLRCADCHTMHNSQNGVRVATDDSGALIDTPHGELLISTCIGCHRDTTQSDGSAPVPIIYSSTAPTALFTNTYAGGNFKWADTADGTYYPYGHNVKGLSVADNAAMYPPPGYGGNIGTWTATEQLTCAGTYGCHGDRTNDSSDTGTTTDDYEAMRGAHHADDTTINGASVGTSFRFLLGVVGTEMNTDLHKWAYNMDNVNHNEYKGLITPATNVSDDSPGTGGSISGLCAECHGEFHSQPNRETATNTASPWLRHPTDILLNTGDEVTDYNDPTDTYNIKAPVARVTLSAPSSTVTESSDVVMCLSCHVAHASPNKDLLRFVYDDTMTITGGSCLTCHTGKL